MGEALALRWEDVDLDQAVVRVNGSVGRVRRLDGHGTEVIRKSKQASGSAAVVALPAAVARER